MLDNKDKMIQELCPTVMVPAYSNMSEVISGYRFLMAKHGLYIEARQPWGYFRLPLWISQRALPYGNVEAKIILNGGDIPYNVIESCIKYATIKSKEGKEWIGWVTWSNNNVYKLVTPQIIKESFDRVIYSRPILPVGEYLVMNIHSHPFNMYAFSKDDDIDDCGGVYYSGVISFDKDNKPQLKIRLCIEGFFFNTNNVGGGI